MGGGWIDNGVGLGRCSFFFVSLSVFCLKGEYVPSSLLWKLLFQKSGYATKHLEIVFRPSSLIFFWKVSSIELSIKDSQMHRKETDILWHKDFGKRNPIGPYSLF